MFETYTDDVNYYDFEWPNRANLKTVNDVKSLKLKEIRYYQDSNSLITGIKFVSHEMASPFFSASKDNKTPPVVLPAFTFYEQQSGQYLVTNVTARIETNDLISNVYFNKDKCGIQRIGVKRGNGELSRVDVDEGEEIIGLYGNYNDDRTHISGLGFIVWKPAP